MRLIVTTTRRVWRRQETSDVPINEEEAVDILQAERCVVCVPNEERTKKEEILKKIIEKYE